MFRPFPNLSDGDNGDSPVVFHLRRFIPVLLLFLTSFGCQSTQSTGPAAPADLPERPNILFLIADDWGYPHASIYRDLEVKTPGFDRIAREGALFTHAFVASPSCTPSRSAILTGQPIWRLGPGANLHGYVPTENPIYPDLLEEQANYFVGHWRKGAHGAPEVSGRPHDATGKSYQSFDAFLEKLPDDRPFCFWFGTHDPHRPYNDLTLNDRFNIDPSEVNVPPYLPDREIVRHDIANYYAEVRRFDTKVEKQLNLLEEHGKLDETIIVVTGDHGWPFPRAKTTLYDAGTRVPLAIRWPEGISKGKKIDALVSLMDLPATYLDLAGVEKPDEMLGHSLVPLLTGNETKEDQEHWQRVFTARERHAVDRDNWKDDLYNPMRSIRTEEYLLIRNFAPEHAGGGPVVNEDKTFLQWMQLYNPTRNYLGAKRNEPKIKPIYELIYSEPPKLELYHIPDDPYQMNNLADDPSYQDVKERLHQRLMDRLRETGDPRVTDKPVRFPEYKPH